MNSPEQRLISGVTALMTQPVIDYKNKNVDEDTRCVSVARTCAKIIAGTLVGVIVRKSFITAFKNYSQHILNIDASGACSFVKKRKSDIFVPLLADLNGLSRDQITRRLENYIKAGGTVISTVAMMATNFLIDAPLTACLTNLFVKYIKKSDSLTKEKEVKHA